jgi:hypothetical protein
MKRSEFLKLAGIGLVGAIISPAVFSKNNPIEVLDDVDIRNMISEHAVIKNKTFELHSPLLLDDTDVVITKNHFILVGEDASITGTRKFRGEFSFNFVEVKKTTSVLSKLRKRMKFLFS